MTGIKVRKISSRAEFAKAYAIRVRVFVREQGVPKEIELDDEDKTAAHFLAAIDGRPVGTARLIIKRGQARIGRMAVLKSCRGRGVGAELLKSAIRLARRRRIRRIFLHAQVQVIGFYDKMGFRCVGPVFKEAGIRHRKMVLTPGR
jgi:predicted GNAT family N-acyltransferase